MFNPELDLTKVHEIVRVDSSILANLSLVGANAFTVAEHIIKRNRWHDLIMREDEGDSNPRRLCIYFRPSRPTGNEKYHEEVLQVDCHMQANLDNLARETIARCEYLLHKKKVNNRYLWYDGHLGDLPTMPGFYCMGARFKFYRSI
jgi:hypothetical protein